MNTFLSSLSDSDLLSRCEHFGKQARLWRQKFLGLLPEVAKRELFRQKGFDSIFTFAFILGGVSEKQVRKVLNMENAFQDKLVLHKMLIDGEISVNKLAAIATVVTPENQEHLASQVKLLPKSALETLAKDMRSYDSLIENKEQNINMTTQLSFTPGGSESNLHLDSDIEEQLTEMQHKGININAELRLFLIQRQQKARKS